MHATASPTAKSYGDAVPPNGTVAIVGGGLVGLATAYALVSQRPGLTVTVYDKAERAGAHQSTHNSGVLHAGLYYKPGSLKARLAVSGIRKMKAFCRDHGVAYEECGKLVVATRERELPELSRLYERGIENGLAGVRLLTPAEARELEPHVSCVGAVHVPEEGIVSYAGVVDALVAEVRARGGEVRTSMTLRGLARRGRRWHLQFDQGECEADFLIACAGLQADRVLAMTGGPSPCRIVPFRGEYFTLRPAAAHLVRNLIYPVPDRTFPFLGVHLTRLITGEIEAGPNAVLALHREGYRRGAFSARDVLSSAGFPGLWRFVARHAGTTVHEVRRSYSRAMFCADLQRLVPELRESDLGPGGAGVRAQAMLPNGELVQDFLFVRREASLHVLNAPSPAATASLAIGEEIAAQVS